MTMLGILEKNKWPPVTNSPLFNVALANCLFEKAASPLLFVFLEALYSLHPLLLFPLPPFTPPPAGLQGLFQSVVSVWLRWVA